MMVSAACPLGGNFCGQPQQRIQVWVQSLSLSVSFYFYRKLGFYFDVFNENK
jgi:hypothetical protein